LSLRPGHACLVFALFDACGGRIASELEPDLRVDAGAGGAASSSGAAGVAGSAGTGTGGRPGQLGNGGGSAVDAAPDVLRDQEGADVVVRDAAPGDACAPLDPNQPCGCPAGDWFVELRVDNASAVRLTAPHVLKLYCTEEAPVAANNGCNDLIRLSACDDAGNDCFYLAVSPTRGFFVGFLSSGGRIRYPFTSGSITLTRDEPPVREGAFMATAQDVSRSVAIEGTFRACAAPYGR